MDGKLSDPEITFRVPYGSPGFVTIRCDGVSAGTCSCPVSISLCRRPRRRMRSGAKRGATPSGGYSTRDLPRRFAAEWISSSTFVTAPNVTIETYIYGNSECEAFSAILSDLQREFLVDGCSAEGHERGELLGGCGGPSRPQGLPGSKATDL